MRIYLVGFMGSGKTTFGRKLAQKLGYAFADLDERLAAQSGKTIPELFANLGEAEFRKLEQEVLHQTMADADVVVSTGGGTPCFFDNMAWMNKQGVTIWLDEPLTAIAARLAPEKEHRPLIAKLSDSELLAFLEKQRAERLSFYSSAQIHLQDETITPDSFKRALAKL